MQCCSQKFGPQTVAHPVRAYRSLSFAFYPPRALSLEIPTSGLACHKLTWNTSVVVDVSTASSVGCLEVH